MTRTTDELLDEIRRLGDAIAAMPDDDPDLTRLKAERDDLRAEAARRADALRHPQSIRTEIDGIERRLAEIANHRIRAGYSEKHLGATVQDPGAYRVAINRRLDENHADEVAELTDRLARLRTLVPGDPAAPSGPSRPSDPA